jgi:hypothetical protein
VVDAVDRIDVEPFDGSPLESLGEKGTVCFFGAKGVDRVVSSSWSVTADGLSVSATNYANCFAYAGVGGRSYTLTVAGVGRTAQVEITTAAR